MGELAKNYYYLSKTFGKTPKQINEEWTIGQKRLYIYAANAIAKEQEELYKKRK